jgi:hypothetical protein
MREQHNQDPRFLRNAKQEVEMEMIIKVVSATVHL